MHLDVAIPKPIPQTFAYSYGEPIAPGCRVIVPFRNSELVGFVLGEATNLSDAVVGRLRPIVKAVDTVPIFSPLLLELAHWLADYYMHPIGEVLRCMLPASLEKSTGASFSLTAAGREALDAETDDGLVMARIFGKKSSLAPTSFHKRIKSYVTKTGEVVDFMQWCADGLVAHWDGKQYPRKQEVLVPGDLGEQAEHGLSPHHLTSDQNSVFNSIFERGLQSTPQKPFLLHGVTGSGKTEVFLRLIAALFALDPSAQALVLVPEISLTPQITQLFRTRFGQSIAVVHSAMPDPERWRETERIRTGHARVLIGPRSAVFAPFANLRLIIVDEEHDSSYKQTSGLHYNGRDTAVVRGRMEKACVVLASATPCLESLYNTQIGKYELAELPTRAAGGSLPDITLLPYQEGLRGALVKADKDGQRVQSEILTIDQRIINELRDNLLLGRQAMVIVNRRGYSFFLYSLEQRKAVSCPNCSISLTVHSRNTMLKCHYCDFKISVSKILREFPGQTFFVVGYGTEQATDILEKEFPNARIARLDSDAASHKGVLDRLLTEFRAGSIDILVGTQILAKGHDFPNVTLIAILEIDQSLNLPDFRAGERTFQLMVQAAGRAGRASLPGKVLIQSRSGANPVIKAGLDHDFTRFSQTELRFRQKFGYPPFARLTVLDLSAAKRDAVEAYTQALEGVLNKIFIEDPTWARRVHVLGPATPPLEIVRRRHRRTIVFRAQDVTAKKQLLLELLAACPPPSAVRMRIDVDPQSLI